VYQGLDRSLKIVRGRLAVAPPSGGATVALGDSRAINLQTGSVDAVLTSPPYLNAIDYMRGHRLALVWLGHTLADLREIRAMSIGSERGSKPGSTFWCDVKATLGDLSELPNRRHAMVDRYITDVVDMAREIHRLLKPGGTTCGWQFLPERCVHQEFRGGLEGP
jgi:hypothetical protein